MILQPRSTPFFGLNRALVVHGSMAVFLIAFIFSDQIIRRSHNVVPIIFQFVAAALITAAAAGSGGPILNIVLIAQLIFMVNIPTAMLFAVAINVLQMMIFWKIWQESFNEAFISTLLYGSFQVFALLLARYAHNAERAQQEVTEINAELMATRSLLVETARDRERLRVSRELHDVAGHSLTALKLNLRQLVRTTDGDAKLTAKESLVLADTLLEDVRALVGSMRESDGLDLSGALRDLCAPFHRPVFEFSIDPDCEVPSVHTARLLLSIAREAITNVVRHAQASHCVVRLHRNDKGLVLAIEDDGRGLSERQMRSGNGITGMTERALEAGAHLSISPGIDGRGTRVLLEWPNP